MRFNKAKYTLEVVYMENANNFELFDFDYDFYDPLAKSKFEEKFINHYYFHEIGFEAIARFKHYLKTRLNEIYPYYNQLYITELKSKNINFLLNKDLREQYTREIIKEGQLRDIINGTTETNGKTSLDTTTGYKESNLDNGIAELTGDKLTNVNETTDKNNQSTSNKNVITSTSNKANEENEVEKYDLLSQGNIGVTSSAQLLSDWRSVLINIDMMIIEECSDLFMQIF